MTLRRRTVVRRIAALVTIAGLAACGSDPDPSLFSTDPPMLAAFGPESLTVSIALGRDTIPAGADYSATAVVRNRTSRVIVATLRCPTTALAVRVLDAQGQVVQATPAACPTGAVAGSTTFQPGDSVMAVVSGNAAVAGVLRIEATYAAVGASPLVTQRALVVRVATVQPLPCTTEIVFGVNVSPHDARTGGLVRGSTAVAVDGSYRETLLPGPGIPGEPAVINFFGVRERPGTYRVTVQAPGYKDWVQDAVVGAGTCHVIPVLLDAALEPTS